MIVSLYTSRVVLNTLGVQDYGIYNVVGGVVSMFSFLNSAMAGGTQRFLNFEMGEGNIARLKAIFNVSLSIHFAIALIVFIFAESIGLWFLNTKLIIPHDKIVAANWVYQFSIFSAMITLTQVPYTASIIAHEKMTVYGYVSIIEVILRLVIVFILVAFSFDKLKLYAILTFLVSLIVAFIYREYCRNRYLECRFKIIKNKHLYLEMISFSSWNLFGNMASVGMNQGQNIILNLFFGPAVNAARAVAMSLNSAVQSFVGSFMTAVNPQIVKSYAVGDKESCLQLIFTSAKFSYFLLFIISVPALLNTNYILDIWLKNPPEYATVFFRLTLIDSLITCLSAPLVMGAQASGRIKTYSILVGSILLLNLPFAYTLLKFGLAPPSVFYVTIGLSLTALFGRLFMLRLLLDLNIIKFITEVVVKCWGIFILTVIPLYYITAPMSTSFFTLLTSSFISILISVILILFVGMSKNERFFIFTTLKSKVNKIKG